MRGPFIVNFQFQVKVKSNEPSVVPRYYLQFHEVGQSPYGYTFAEDEWFWFNSGYLLKLQFDKQIKTQNIKKSNYNCNEENSYRFMDCMENYYSKKLGCILPWTQENTNQNLNICTGKEKFREYKNLSMSILHTEIQNDLKNDECFIVPNCEKRSWDVKFKESAKIYENSTLECK